MVDYIFESNRDEQELHRLRLIEQALDESSIALLQRADIRPSWRCLELGAGAGSIAEWMGQMVGADGQVVAIDFKTSGLQRLSGPPYTLVKGDFLDIDLDGDFDLVHCRYVLIHNESQLMLRKLCEMLKPGGFLVVEEPDFTSAARLIIDGGERSQNRVNVAICRMFEQMQLDPAYGLKLPAKVADQGLQLLRVDARLHLNRGGDTIARMMGESTWALRDKYLATKEASPTDIEKYIENATNQDFWAVYYATVSVIATKSVGK